MVSRCQKLRLLPKKNVANTRSSGTAMQEYGGMYYKKQLHVRYRVGSAFLNPQIFTLLVFLLIYPPLV